MIGAVLLFAAVVPACESYAVPDDDPIRLVKIANGRIETLLTDEAGIDRPRLSPDRRMIVYVRRLRYDANQVVATFVFVDRLSGKQLRTFDVAPDSCMNAVMDLGWRNGEVLWIDGHCNPRCGYYAELDARTGRILRDLHSETFARSSRGDLAHTQCQGSRGHADFLDIGERWVYPPKGDKRPHLFAGSQTWSPDGSRIALADYLPRSGAVDLVILDTSGRVLRRQRVLKEAPDLSEPLEEIGAAGPLLWRRDGTILLAFAGRTFRIDTAGHVKRIHQTLERSEDRSIEVGKTSYRVEDTTCRP
jgi:hypothetical protein